jgi:hypothetical protein
MWSKTLLIVLVNKLINISVKEGVCFYPNFLAYRTLPYRTVPQQTIYRSKNSAKSTKNAIFYQNVWRF